MSRKVLDWNPGVNIFIDSSPFSDRRVSINLLVPVEFVYTNSNRNLAFVCLSVNISSLLYLDDKQGHTNEQNVVMS